MNPHPSVTAAYTNGWRARLAGKPCPPGALAELGYADADAAIDRGRARTDEDVNRADD